MQDNSKLKTIDKEVSQLEKVFKKCEQILKSRAKYQGMSLEELFSFYDEIENGLISYNLLINLTKKEDSEDFKEMATILSRKNSIAGKFLEAQLLNIVVNMISKDFYHKIPKKFRESPWNLKLKDKAYYDKVFESTIIQDKYQDWLYHFLQ